MSLLTVLGNQTAPTGGAVLLSNTMEGTSGVTPTASNSAGPNQFDTWTVPGATNTLTWDNAHAHTGTTSLKVMLAGTTAGTAFVNWNSASIGSQGTIYGRCYAYTDAVGGSNARLMLAVSGVSACGGVYLMSTGKVRIVDANGTTLATSTMNYPLNAWFRVEMDVVGHATAGAITVRIYSSPESWSYDEMLTASGVPTIGAVTQFRYGICTSTLGPWNLWVDDAAVGVVSALGPYVAPTVVPFQGWGIAA